MFLTDNIQSYLDMLLDNQHNSTDDLYTKQKLDKRPIIKKDVAQFLKLIVRLSNPQKIVEIGTNCGFSAVCIGAEMCDTAKLTTIEINETNADIARQVICKYLPEKQIEVIAEDAVLLLPELPTELDLIFIDADKLNYQKYLDFAAINLKKGGLVIMDNLLWKGRVTEIKPDETPSTTFLRNFNLEFTSDSRFISSILPLGDGLGLAVKK